MIQILVFFLVLIMFSTGFSYADPPPQMSADISHLDVPCETDLGQSTGPRSCHIGLRKCSDAKPQFLSDLKKSLEEDRIRRLYPLGFLDPQTKEQTIRDCRKLDPAFAPHDEEGVDIDNLCSPYPGPTCNPLEANCDLSEKSCQDLPITNRYGILERTDSKSKITKSCGSYIKFSKNGAKAKDGFGSLENAHRKGGWIQALRCYHSQIVSEIESGSIKVSPSCQALANDVSELYKMNQAGSKHLCSQPNIQSITNDIQACVHEGEELSKTATLNAEAVKNRMSACQLITARTKLERAFIRFSLCEIKVRAEVADKKIFYKKDGPFVVAIKNQIVDSCVKKARKKCKWSKSCGVRVVTECYQERYPSFIREFIEKHFPSNGQCFSAFNLILPFMIGSLKRRKRRTSVHHKHHPLFGILLIFYLILSGCSSDNNNIVYESNCTGLNGALLDGSIAARCCNGSKAKMLSNGKAPDGCPQYNGSVTTILEDAAKDTSTARTALEQAYSMNSGRNGMELGGIRTQGVELDFGDSKSKENSSPSSQPPSQSSNTTPPTFEKLVKDPNSPQGGSGLLYRNNLGGGTLFGSQTQNSPNKNKEKTNEELSALSLNPDSSTTTAGGNTNDGSRANGFLSTTDPNEFGSSQESSSSSDETAEFGRSISSSDIPPMVSIDPEDYFGRIGVHMSIFKIVERKYQEKTSIWENEKTKSLTRKAVK